MIADFRPERELNLSGIPSYEEFEARMKELCPRDDTPLAVRFTRMFRHMKVRSVRRQEHDGVGLAEAAKAEAVFEWDDISGDLVGFRLLAMCRASTLPAGIFILWIPNGGAADMCSISPSMKAN